MFPMIAGYVMGQRAAARAGAFSVVSNHMSAGGGAGALEALDERVDRLLLVIEAMWTLLKEQGLTDEQLAARIAELDAADGAADGRRAGAITTCTSCGSKVAAGLPRCQICGTETGVAQGPLDGI
jgi:hypothetical protein